MKGRTISYESYGCTMNHGEARTTASILRDAGYEVIGPRDGLSDPESDIVLLFTCDVIKTTERKMRKRIMDLISMGKDLYIAGCLPAIEKESLKNSFPGVKFISSMGWEELFRSLNEHFGTVDPSGMDKGGNEERIDSIVPISNGCLGNCSYCITRMARGELSSYDPRIIIDQIRSSVKNGLTEVLLTSQDTGIYGMDMNDIDLGSLLELITDSVDGSYRIRVGMMNPTHAISNMDSILAGFRDERVFRFFHVPVQSGSDRILGRMRRGYTADGFRSMVEQIRRSYPKATISTDVIIGFPGETEEDHESTVELIKEIGPEILNITRFSSRPGTDAAMMEDPVKGGIMKERSRQMSKLHRSITRDKLEKRMGSHGSCLVTEVGKSGSMVARDGNYMPIVIKGDRSMLGRFLNVESFDIGPTYLIGGVVDR